MALQSFSFSVINGTTTPTFAVVNTLNFVQLSTQDVVLTLPAAVAGTYCKVFVVTHPVRPLSNGVVRVRPGAGDFFDVKSQFFHTNEAVIWELGSSVTFFAFDADNWSVVDVL